MITELDSTDKIEVKEIENPHTAIVQKNIENNEVKILVFLNHGEQRLITFEVPNENCRVQDLLEQLRIHVR